MDAIYGELRILLASFLLGTCLTLSYDLLRLGRKVLRRSWIWVGLEDIFFWLAAALLFAVMCLRENDGNVRWYMVVAAIAGGSVCLILESLAIYSYKIVTKWLHGRKK